MLYSGTTRLSFNKDHDWSHCCKKWIYKHWLYESSSSCIFFPRP
uniref:Uncharacterized protein n=1 Tax=Rhizophora mucronata TaxID=61149 RepID=A0A2P2IPY6_RHIMU